jgi:D-arabinose 1-dehydrogenase-like Zn-dependent alcohol dehydrogenase
VEELTKMGGAKVILGTVPSAKAMSAVLGGLSANGKLMIIGASDEPLQVPINQLISARLLIMGWYSGSSIDSQDTLTFSALSGVRSMNETFPLDHTEEACELMMSGELRFRSVLMTGKN